MTARRSGAPLPTLKEIADMNRTSIERSLVAALALAGAASYAATPDYHYKTSTSTYGTAAAIATTPPGGLDDRSGYVVAAVVDSSGGLEVKAWQDTTHALNEVGYVDAETNTIVATAAAGVDSSHVVTADIDVNGVLSLRTWTLGGKQGIAQLNHYHSAENTATPLGTTPSLGMVALSPTQIVAAYEDDAKNLSLQAWTVSDTTAAPELLGPATKGGVADQVAIAVIDSATVITAVITPDSKTLANDLEVTTWGVDGTGIHLKNQQVVKGVVGDLYPSVAIGATTVETVDSKPPFLSFTRRAFTPIVNGDNLIEVIDWQISPSGTISKVGKPSIGGPEEFAFAVAGCMLQTGIPMTVWATSTQPVDENPISVGWFEEGLNAEYTEISGLGTGINSVTATTAGNDFNVLDPYRPVHAYFITGALVSGGGLPPSVTHEGTLKLQVWSYPIVLPLT
jgi:hypothetical protein